MEKYFIIKANRWCLCWIKGTMEELESFLSSIGSKIVRIDNVYEEDMHLIYREKIVTETDAVGFSKDTYNRLYGEIEKLLSSVNERAFNFNKGNIEVAIHDCCKDLPIKTDRVEILASDGEEYELPPNHFCARRTFYRFSDIDVNEFRHSVRECAYVQLTKEQEG